MPSIHPDYEYDIFISYRQNDNKRDKWITNFVEALKDELEATLKNPVTIYFDENPHDGLLETHQVAASLEKKLKCLVFIPIISQTFCDTESFAWSQEFMPFLKMATSDELGMNITLANGNVASRVLPIRIHDLDDEDQQLLEKELNGPLRSIDFIHKAAGVNRPLSSEDDKVRESGKVLYSDQINKVANALKELGVAVLKKHQGEPAVTTSKDTKPLIANPTNKTVSRKQVSYALGVLLVILVSLFSYWAMVPKETVPNGDLLTIKSIAVLPFENMSNDPEQEYFSDGISEELINALAKMTNLKVAGRTSSFSFKNKHEDLRKVGESLGVNTILEGSVRKSGNTVRITAQLINVKDGFHLWSETFDRELSDIFKVQDEITAAIIKELRVHLDEEELTPTKTLNVQAYASYLKARQKLAQRGINNLIEARDLFYHALALDSSYSPTYSGLSKTLSLLNNYSQGDSRFKNSHEEALVYAEKALDIDPNNAEAYMAFGIAKSWYLWNWESAEKDIKKSIELNPNDAEVNNFAGDFYRIITDFDKAIEFESKALEFDPLHAVNHWDLGITLQKQGKLEEAKRYFRSCFRLDKELIYLIYPGFALAFQSDPIINEMDYIFNTLDHKTQPESLVVQFKAAIALGKDDKEKAKQYVQELEILAEKGFASPAYLLDYNYILENSEKMEYWASKTVAEKDGLLIYESFKMLPELYENEKVSEILSSPELDALYEIRRRNLGVN